MRMISLDWKMQVVRLVRSIALCPELVATRGITVTYLIAYDFALLDVIKGWHCKSSTVVRVLLEVDIAQVGHIFVDWIRCHVVPWNPFVRLCKPPS